MLSFLAPLCLCHQMKQTPLIKSQLQRREGQIRSHTYKTSLKPQLHVYKQSSVPLSVQPHIESAYGRTWVMIGHTNAHAPLTHRKKKGCVYEINTVRLKMRPRISGVKQRFNCGSCQRTWTKNDFNHKGWWSFLWGIFSRLKHCDGWQLCLKSLFIAEYKYGKGDWDQPNTQRIYSVEAYN